jgi:hypothetical protein
MIKRNKKGKRDKKRNTKIEKGKKTQKDAEAD